MPLHQASGLLAEIPKTAQLFLSPGVEQYDKPTVELTVSKDGRVVGNAKFLQRNVDQPTLAISQGKIYANANAESVVSYVAYGINEREVQRMLRAFINHVQELLQSAKMEAIQFSFVVDDTNREDYGVAIYHNDVFVELSQIDTFTAIKFGRWGSVEQAVAYAGIDKFGYALVRIHDAKNGREITVINLHGIITPSDLQKITVTSLALSDKKMIYAVLSDKKAGTSYAGAFIVMSRELIEFDKIDGTDGVLQIDEVAPNRLLLVKSGDFELLNLATGEVIRPEIDLPKDNKTTDVKLRSSFLDGADTVDLLLQAKGWWGIRQMQMPLAQAS
jgi:hypothetical protein